ncbi:hypothetical protein ACWCOP_11420 [Maricaulaceae bacterium MS644]
MGDPVWILLHILVLVYWLGGDLGAFYASRLVVDEARPAAGRLAAASILMNVDMAPRMALIFAFPTGLALSVSRGWLELDFEWVWLAFAVAAVWAMLAWLVHLKAGPLAVVRGLDMAIRLIALGGLLGAGAGMLAGWIDAPLFLAAKLFLLALAIACGLLIRRALGPFGPAFAQLAKGDAGPAENAAIRASLAHAKIYVLTIWAALLAAAALGVYTPA